jgi:hypothetical protein
MIIGGWAIEVLDGIIRLKTEEIIMKGVYCGNDRALSVYGSSGWLAWIPSYQAPGVAGYERSLNDLAIELSKL